MYFSRSRRAAAVAVTAASLLCGTGALLSSAPASAATCSDVDLVFARGTGEPQGPSVLQNGTLNALKSGLSGKSVSQYSVVYPAGSDQNAKPGADDLVKHVSSVAAECPNTKFVLGGYSQGATVVDLSIGVRVFGGSATPIPTNLAPKVAAIVTFGNPLGNQKLAAATPTYGSRVKEFCAAGDPVCQNGSNFAAHLEYISNGDTTKAGQFAATKVLESGPNPGDPTTTTTPTTGPPTTVAPPPPPRPWWCWWSWCFAGRSWTR
jgi:cutinase